MKVLSLCDLTGNMVKPWADRGHSCMIVDLQHPEGVSALAPNITAIGANLREFKFNKSIYTPDIIFAFPPCTDLASSGARWFKDKGLKKFIQALELVNICLEIAEYYGCPYMIENPVGRLSSWRKPDYMFDPCDYAGYLAPDQQLEDSYTKKTCLWTNDTFIMPPVKKVEPILGSKMHKIPPGPDRANLRSVTPRGFAQAVYEVNRRA